MDLEGKYKMSDTAFTIVLIDRRSRFDSEEGWSTELQGGRRNM